MLLSRFWYVALGLVIGALVFLLSMAQSMFNRAGERSLGEGLSADSQVVSWYLKDDARMRSSHLVKFALDPTIAKTLHQASQSETKLPSNFKDDITAAMKKVNQEIPADQAFDAVFAIDQNGRVVGRLGYEQASGMDDFELGGYPVVADALHGYVRDDTLIWGRIYRVVARPVEYEVGSMPAGAIVGARIVDDKFARELSGRTGAAVAFYMDGQRAAAGAPEGFATANLDQIVTDLDELAGDPDYKEKGRSSLRRIGATLGVQYTRLPGEAYALGAGFAVARDAAEITSPFGFFEAADDKDKASVNWILIGGLCVAALVIGILLSVFEHTMPLHKFRLEALKLARGEADQLQVSKFFGSYRRLAADVNDGIDKVASTAGGVSRRATDLSTVLGDLPAQPVMAAFAVPDFAAPAAAPQVPQPPQRFPQVPGAARAQQAAVEEVADPEAEWRAVYEQFVVTKQQCGEPTEGFTYDKFRQTLVKNQEALVARHGAAEVKFSVYVKEGRAALKATPVR
ncbi:MAG TPA: MXAN_5187 family protein [Polyangiaceae bacterium]|nr:MXAN_5187 family protein [Polyangiaceae bacterium]